MKLTPSQQAAVAHRGSNLLVSASAGAGKTSVLVARCLGLLADPRTPCPIERMLVVTFTRAAAAELRVRLGAALRQQAEQAAGRGVRERLRRQAALVDVADIGTIDAWVGRLVREHFDLAGIDPGFATLAPEEALLLREDVLDDLFDWIYRAEDEVAGRARDWLRRHADTSDDFLREHIRRLNAYREHVLVPEAWFAQQRRRSEDAVAQPAAALELLASAVRDECVRQAEQLAGLLPPQAGEQEIAVLAEYLAALQSWVQELADPAKLPTVAQAIDASKIKKPKDLPAGLAGLYDEVADRWLKKRLQQRWGWEALEPIIASDTAAAALLATLFELEARYDGDLRRAKQQRAAYEFADVQRFALNLLGQPDTDGAWRPTDVALRLRERYEHVLIDEYQDTSPIQATLFRLITRDDPTNRFMVGDVKQSIYGFREAEPRLLAAQADAFANQTEPGRLIHLADNFRSHAGVLDALNPIFAGLFDRDLGGTDFGPEEQLSAGRQAAEPPNPTLDAAPRVSLHIVPELPRGYSAADEAQADLERMEREALVIAGQIKGLHDGGARLPDREADGLRPVQYKDIVVLLRAAKQNVAHVVRTLRRQGIPCVASGREALLGAPEVQDLCNALRLLSNRRQDLPLAAYLRGPLVGLTAAELLAIRNLTPRGDFLDAVAGYRASGQDRALVAKLEAAWQRLDRWQRAARCEALPELLRRIIREGELELFVAGQQGGTTRVALQQAMLRFAADFARRGRQGVAEFLDYLERLSEQEFDPGASVVTGEDVVRVMTIHASKGLEFPVVFLAGAGKDFNAKTMADPLQCDEQRGVGLRFLDFTARRMLISAVHHVNKHAAQARSIEEELRLLYVATTRARERLCIIGHAAADAWDKTHELFDGRPLPLLSRQSAGGMLDWLMMATASQRLATGQPPRIAIHVELPSAEAAEPSTAPEGIVSEPQDEPWIEAALRQLARAADSPLAALPAVISVSALKQLASPSPEADPVYVPDLGQSRLSRPRFAAEEPAPDGRVTGLAVHRFLQHADLTRLASADDVRRQLSQLVATGLLEEAEAAAVQVDDITWLAATEPGRLMGARAASVRREQAFVYALPVGVDDEQAIVRGVIDCLVETDDGLHIIDYKTDRVRDDADFNRRVAGYQTQLQLYAAAAREIFAQPVVSAQLTFLAHRQVIDVPLSAPEFTRLLAR